MATIKYGLTDRDVNEQIINRKFGYWHFGEPQTFYILNTLLSYLPRFIVQNELCVALMTAIAISTVKLSNALSSLIGYRTAGTKGSYKFANEDLQLYVNPNLERDKLITAIRQAYSIHAARGTYAGIIADLERLSDSLISIQYFDFEESGWYLGSTYPMYADAHNISKLSNCMIGLDNMLEIVIRNKSTLKDSEFIKIIREELVPLLVNIKVNIIIPHCIKFSEPKDGFKIQFGNFKYGELI